MADPTSWTKPGRVSSAERAPPPTVSSASNTLTERPLRASSTAAANPFGPEPTTTASYVPLPLALTFPILLCHALPACAAAHAAEEILGSTSGLGSAASFALCETCFGLFVEACALFLLERCLSLVTRLKVAQHPTPQSWSALVPSSPLEADIETGRRGDGHHSHHAALDRVAHLQVRGFGYAPGHVQREHDDSLLADLVDGPGNLSTHERARQDERHRSRQASHGPYGPRQVLLADQRDSVDRDTLAADVVAIGFGDRPDHHLSHLGSATDHDDPLTVYLLKRGRPLDRPHYRQRVEVADQGVRGGDVL